MTPEAQERLTANTESVMAKIASTSCAEMPCDASNILGGSVEGAYNVAESTNEQVLFRVNLAEEETPGNVASVVGGCGASGDLASQPRIKAESDKFPWNTMTASTLSSYLGTSLLRHMGSDAFAEMQVSRCGTFVTWVISVTRCL